MPQFDNVHDAWTFLTNHPIFDLTYEGNRIGSAFDKCLVIHVVKVNAETRNIEPDGPRLNTEPEVWLECGTWTNPEDVEECWQEQYPDGLANRDPQLDCGAPTFEEALISLAKLVAEHYGQGCSG